MKRKNIKTGYDFMKYCRMPLYFQRTIREMKVGDTFFMGKYTHPISDDNNQCYVAEAWIEKKRGAHTFYGTWTFPTKPSRALIITSGKFRMLKGGIIEFEDKPDAVESFALACRYLVFFLNNMSYEDKQHYFSANSRPLLNGIWLDNDLIERKQRVKQESNHLKWFKINYSDHEPTNQLFALINSTGAWKVLPRKN